MSGCTTSRSIRQTRTVTSAARTHRDCETDPSGFATTDEAYAVLRQHDAHGFGCMPFLAAHAYVSADLNDD